MAAPSAYTRAMAAASSGGAGRHGGRDDRGHHRTDARRPHQPDRRPSTRPPPNPAPARWSKMTAPTRAGTVVRRSNQRPSRGIASVAPNANSTHAEQAQAIGRQAGGREGGGEQHRDGQEHPGEPKGDAEQAPARLRTGGPHDQRDDRQDARRQDRQDPGQEREEQDSPTCASKLGSTRADPRRMPVRRDGRMTRLFFSGERGGGGAGS